MHLCFIYPGFPPENHAGGIGTYIEEIINAFKDKGHVIEIISRSSDFSDKIQQYSKDITIYRVGENPQAKILPKFLFRNQGYISHYKKIANIVKKIDQLHHIDLIEACDWGAECYELMETYNKRIIIRCHTPAFISESYNINNPNYLSDGIKEIEKNVLSQAQYIASPSKCLINEISKSVVMRGTIFIDPYPINGQVIPKKKNYNITLPKILSVGRIEERKGQDIIIQACHLLHKKGIKVKIDLIGTDTINKNKQRTSSAFVKKSRNPKFKINFIGEIPRNQVLKIYKNYDIYIAASRFDNFPFTLLEAMSSGVPSIASENSGMKEILTHRKTGLFFNGTSKHLAKQILKLLRSQILREAVGINASDFIKNKFSPDIVYQKIIKNYQKIWIESMK